MPLLAPLFALFSPAKLILGGVLIVAALSAWGMWTYRGHKIERLEKEIAAAHVEIANTAQTANDNAAALERTKADWARADALVAAREKELANANARIKAARDAARRVPASACGPSPNGIAFSRKLYGIAAATPDSAPSRTNPPRPAAKPAR